MCRNVYVENKCVNKTENDVLSYCLLCQTDSRQYLCTKGLLNVAGRDGAKILKGIKLQLNE